MKKLFVGLFGLLLLLGACSTANAGMNIRQNGDGSTDWQDASGNNFNVGAVYLTIKMADVTVASTAYGVSPIPNGKITSIQGTIWGQPNGTANVMDMYVSASPFAAFSTANEITDGSATTGMAFTSTMSTGHTVQFTPTSNNTVAKGSTIFIHTDGGSTNAHGVTFVLTIEPDGT